MKKLIPVILILVLTCTGCMLGLKRVEMTSYHIDSISPYGLSGMKANISVEINNPGNKFTCTDINGDIYLNGKPCLKISSDSSLEIDGKCNRRYQLGIVGKVSGFGGIISLANFIKDGNAGKIITADICANVSMNGKKFKRIERKGIKVEL